MAAHLWLKKFEKRVLLHLKSFDELLPKRIRLARETLLGSLSDALMRPPQRTEEASNRLRESGRFPAGRALKNACTINRLSVETLVCTFTIFRVTQTLLSE